MKVWVIESHGTTDGLALVDWPHPVIDSTFSFADAKAAFDYPANGEHFGKVVIQVS